MLAFWVFVPVIIVYLASLHMHRVPTSSDLLPGTWLLETASLLNYLLALILTSHFLVSIP